MTKVTVSNMVMSLQIQMLFLWKIAMSDAKLLHEIELLPASLIRKCLIIHIAALHSGKIIETDLKTEEKFYGILSTLLCFLESNHTYE